MAANGTELTVHRSSDEAATPAMSSKSPPDPPVSMLRWLGGKAAWVLAGPGPIVFTCVCAALAYGCRKRRAEAAKAPEAAKAEVRWHKLKLQRSMSIAALRDGKLVLERIVEAQEARLNKEELKNAEEKMKELLADPRLSFTELHKAAAKLEMSGREDEAIKLLKEAKEEYEAKGPGQETHELEMLLVEMLIYKGEYDDALKCKCLDDENIADARGPLFKAIIFILKNDEDNAKKFFDQFNNIQSQFNFSELTWKDSPVCTLVHDFAAFKNIVLKLQGEINHALKRGKEKKAPAVQANSSV